MSYRSEMERVERAHRAREVRASIEPARAAVDRKGPKEWAWKLRERELGGEKLTPASSAAWRVALRHELLSIGEAE